MRRVGDGEGGERKEQRSGQPSGHALGRLRRPGSESPVHGRAYADSRMTDARREPDPPGVSEPALAAVGQRVVRVDRALLDDVRVVASGAHGWLAINKPAGLPSVQAKDVSLPHALTWLCERYLKVAALAWPATIHRLDMDTSGLLLLALDAETQRAVSGQFEARTVSKRYVAVVDGRPPADAGVIEAPMRADWARRPVQVIDQATGRAAVTRYRVVREEPEGAWRIELEPLTGRSHQLRVHMASVGCPIVGDPLYGWGAPAGPTGTAKAPPRRAARMLLHASGLGFIDPATGQRVELACDPGF